MSEKGIRFAMWKHGTTGERIAEWVHNRHDVKITKIDLDLTPSDVDWQPDLAGLSYFLIVVRDRTAYLALMTFDEAVTVGEGRILNHEKLGISEQMLLEAIGETKGGIDQNGYYPISLEIKEKLAECLRNSPKDALKQIVSS